MSEFIEFAFDDETRVLMEVFPAPGGTWTGEDVPAEEGPLRPSGGIAEATFGRAGRALGDALRPLVPVLQSVHDTVRSTPGRPDSVTVTLGLKLTNQLQLGIVSGDAEASLTIAATWHLEPGQGHNENGQ